MGRAFPKDQYLKPVISMFEERDGKTNANEALMTDVQFASRPIYPQSLAIAAPSSLGTGPTEVYETSLHSIQMVKQHLIVLIETMRDSIKSFTNRREVQVSQFGE